MQLFDDKKYSKKRIYKRVWNYCLKDVNLLTLSYQFYKPSFFKKLI